MKKTLILLIMLVITLSSVCAKEPVTIKFWHAMDGVRGDALNQLIDEFNKEHPDINVVGEFKGITDYNKDKYNNSYNILFQQLLINISINQPPDVAQVYENWTSQFLTIDALVPVENFVNSDEGFTEEEISDFIPTFLEANKYNGKLWTLPFNKSIYVLYYNKEIFEEKNITPPATWQELTETAKKLTLYDVEGNILRSGFSFKADVDTFSLIMLSDGAPLINDSGKAVFNDEKGFETINFLKELVKEKVARISFNPRKEFIEGKCAMFIDTTSKIAALDKNTGFQYGIAPCPFNKEKGKILFAGTNLAVFSGTSPEKQKASWTFIKWLTDTENTAKWSMDTGYLPVRTSAIESSSFQSFLKENEKYKIGLDELKIAVVAPRVPAWQSIRGIIDDTVFNSMVTEEDVKTSLNEAANTANQFLN